MQVCIGCNKEIESGRFYNRSGETVYVCEDCVQMKVFEMMKLMVS